MIKALIHKLKYETAIDLDRLPEQMKEIEQVAAADANPVEQSLLYSLLAEMYAQYYQANAYSINQRTELPMNTDDIREWSKNRFIQTIAGWVNLSLSPDKEKALQSAKISAYKEILTGYTASGNRYPTVYDFLLNQGIETLKNLNDKELYATISKLYERWQQFRTSQGNRLAMLTVQLDYLEFRWRYPQSNDAGTAYLQALSELEKQYRKEDCCVEILYRKALYYRDYSGEDKREESLKKAYETCLNGIENYPSYERIGLLQNLLADITQSSLSVTGNNAVYPGQNLELTVTSKNIQHLTVELYRIHAPASVYANRWSREGQYKKSGRLLETHTLPFTNEFPYLNQDTIIRIPVQTPGNYEYVLHADNIRERPANQQFSVSRLAAVARSVDSQREYLVVDRMSGKPLTGAQLRLYARKNNRLTPVRTLTTDVNGLATGGNDKDLDAYSVSSGNDTALIPSPLPWISTYRESENHRITLSLFTDRSIYRPGQTVYFKGIATETGKNLQRVLPDKTYTLIFRDANGKEIAGQQRTTNEMGSFSGEFLIPQGLLNGNFSIQSDAGGYVTLKVEEYKRPSFDIRFQPNDKALNFGDTVTVEGNAATFSGVNLKNAELHYRIMRQNHWLFRMRYLPPVPVAEGSVQTGDDGSFNIRFKAEKAPDDFHRPNVYYTYIVEVLLTDTRGETQSANTHLSIGDKSMYLTVKGLQEVMNKDELPQVFLQAANLSGNPVSVQGKYVLYSLKTDNHRLLDEDESHWKPDAQVFSGSFQTGKELDLTPCKSLPSGRYRLQVEAGDEQGKTVETQHDFKLFSVDDQRPPVPVYEWLVAFKTTCKPGEKAEIIYGSSAEVYVLYELFQNDKKIAISRFRLNNENRKIEIPFLESYGEGITASFSFVKDGRFFTKTVPIYKKQEDKTLKLNLQVFRDRLLPGQSEEWKLSVKDAENHPVVAELLADMYDASLDKIYAHEWHFNPLQPVHLWTVFNQPGSEFDVSGSSVSHENSYKQVPEFSQNTFNWFGFYIRNNSPTLRAFGKSSFDNSVLYAAESSDLAGSVNQDARMQEEKPQEIQIRRNFNETAFFYPQLKTNEAGETTIAFTVPESNTTWKFMGLAHTGDLKSGQILQEIISQKKLMLTPNIPRFMRTGDRITISSNLSNLSDERQTGAVTIECFDPESRQPNLVIEGATQPFSVEAGQTIPLSWTFDVPAGIELTALKIVAQSPDFSDGEQHLVPVLPNRILVTESMSLDVPGGQSRSFPLDSFLKSASSTLEPYRLTLELTSHPAWYAVQALPVVSTPESDNVISWFAAYYSNTMAQQIANSTPKIKQMIEVWAKQAIPSPLEKNPELKTLLLQETPWVAEAQTETEQIQRLAQLFDVNRSNQLNRQAWEKLQALQAGDGGWTWFKGMNSNVAITQWILYGLGEMTPESAKGELVTNALRFIDKQFKQYYDNQVKNHRPSQPHQPTLYELEYLFVRSCYRHVPLGDVKEAVQFYTNWVETSWMKNPNLYGRALAALILQRNGNTKTAQAIVKSLREHASRKPGFGMYWANNTTHCFMTQSAVSVHTFIMKAFRETGSNREEMDEMKQWLLKQKQTQRWESVPATVNAIHTLLTTGSDWLEPTGKVSIRLGEETFHPGSTEPGTGYFKMLTNHQKFPEGSPLILTNPNAGPAYGALYQQYFEAPDQIRSKATGLSVTKSLITPQPALQVGDKVTVRLTVRADRDLEYVSLKDLRASCLEPADRLSGLQWKQGLMYYQSPEDASMNFFFSALPKGTYVIEYPVYVSAPGDYSNGIATLQCLYAPELVAHTSGGRIHVNEK